MAHNFLIIGQGDIGLPVTNRLAGQGRAVTGLARGQRDDYDLHAKATFIQADALELTADAVSPFTHIAIIVTPDEYNADAYKHTYYGIAEHLANLADQLPNLERVVFISSTGVYGQDEGQWVDVFTKPTEPKREASRYILQAEQVLQSAYADKAVIIRPSGIYGKERLMRIRKAKEANKEPMPIEHWSNRIMDTDLVNIVVNVLTLDNVVALYLASDFAPVTSLELTNWLCEKLGHHKPPANTRADDKESASGKRVHSNVPLAWLEFPDWRAGYAHILQSMEND